MQLKTIKVYGNLRKFLGRSTFQAAVNSPQQAYSFLKANFVGLEKHMNNQIYQIKMGGRVITQDFVASSGQGDIQIIPVAVGSDFVVNFFEDAFNFIADNIVPFVTTFVTGGFSQLLTVAALTLASDLLTPDLPTNNVSSVGDTDPNIRGSYTFTGIQNVSSSGVPIPILYGYVYSGSILISSGVDNAQLVAMLSSTMTYTQSGNTITVTANGHSFRNGENIDVNFISGPLANHPSLDPCTFGVENVTANTFQMSTGTWNSQTYSNAGNVLEVTMRNKP
jgi:predicted phage tail protein